MDHGPHTPVSASIATAAENTPPRRHRNVRRFSRAASVAVAGEDTAAIRSADPEPAAAALRRRLAKLTRELREREKSEQTMRAELAELHDNSDENWKCSICFEGPTVDGKSCATFTTTCGHKFHFKCIKKSVAMENLACPLCRRSFHDMTPPKTPFDPAAAAAAAATAGEEGDDGVDISAVAVHATAAARRAYRPPRVVEPQAGRAATPVAADRAAGSDADGGPTVSPTRPAFRSALQAWTETGALPPAIFTNEDF